jgi:hypothetical protein
MSPLLGVDSTLMKNREDISPLKTSNGDIDDEHDIQGNKTEQPKNEQECAEKYEMVSGCHLDRKNAALISNSENDSGIDPESPRHEIDRFIPLPVADDSATSSKHTANSESGKTLDNTRNTSGCSVLFPCISCSSSMSPLLVFRGEISSLFFIKVESTPSGSFSQDAMSIITVC